MCIAKMCLTKGCCENKFRARLSDECSARKTNKQQSNKQTNKQVKKRKKIFFFVYSVEQRLYCQFCFICRLLHAADVIVRFFLFMFFYLFARHCLLVQCKNAARHPVHLQDCVCTHDLCCVQEHDYSYKSINCVTYLYSKERAQK